MEEILDKRVEAFNKSKDVYVFDMSIDETVECLDSLYKKSNDKNLLLYRLLLEIVEVNAKAKIVGNPCGERSKLYIQKSRLLDIFVAEVNEFNRESEFRKFDISWIDDDGPEDVQVCILIRVPDYKKPLFFHSVDKIKGVNYLKIKFNTKGNNVIRLKKAIKVYLEENYGFVEEEKPQKKKKKTPEEIAAKKEEKQKRLEKRMQKEFEDDQRSLKNNVVVKKFEEKPKKENKPLDSSIITKTKRVFKSNITNGMSQLDKFMERFKKFKK